VLASIEGAPARERPSFARPLLVGAMLAAAPVALPRAKRRKLARSLR
jgi:hypothetical protein